MNFVKKWAAKTELRADTLVGFIGIQRGKFYDWAKRFGHANEHNAHIPRDHWLEDVEKKAILDYELAHPLAGYRRLAFMMIDDNIVAVSPATVYRVLKAAGRLERWNRKASAKGTGFVQPLKAHEHWHVDISYINIRGTFYYLCSILDGYSRAIVHWEIRESMTEPDVQAIIQGALERSPGAQPRIISDNGPQFIAKDFKEFIRVTGMSHVRTSPYYPQSNGKIERWHKTLKTDAIRPRTPLDLEDARRVVAEFVDTYNGKRLHSSIGYVTPADKLAGRAEAICKTRDERLDQARQTRAARRKAAREAAPVAA